MSEDNKFKSLFDSPEWQESQEEQRNWEDEFEKSSEEAWNSLDKDTQLKVFCAISRRIFQAELKDQGSYRHALYNVFGFGPEAYAPAQVSGYLSIHNAICNDRIIEDVMSKFAILASKYNISEEDAKNFLHETFLYF
jgi:hypothetical protein